MNDETKKIQEQLEKATAPGVTIDGSLDAETKFLREGWLALDRLIEEAQPNGVAPPTLQYPLQAEPVKRGKFVDVNPLAALAALAASLLVAALIASSLVGDKQGEMLVKDQPSKIQSLPVEEVTSPVHADPVIVQNEQKSADTFADELDWDAPLDSEIAAAGQEMLRIQADWYASDDTSSAIYYRMQQMQQDLSDNML